MLGNILIGVAGVLVLFVTVVATRPSAYHVERELAVAAPPDLVFGVLNDLHQFAGGMFMNMDNMLGADIEKGLAQLKAVAEGKQVAVAAAGAARADADKGGRRPG
ncbi:hypothetical protein [Melittangium boletus]|uniref:Uncharacterized protein n=1 Tax=Melittangium boletus DSM 14713 TaxID=1294270 RepID=A0A250IRS1_9BACT|nr:hypothetical protein [Melittangium boletus]ATB33887.1 hypothetical protein MEBOL_007388 [Melittangium boletus DSM 14713]